MCQILFIGGHDPTGGAGIQADIETATAHGCRAYSLITCLTAQDTADIWQLYPQNTHSFCQQAEVLLADIQPDWIKIGLIGSLEIAQHLLQMLSDLNKPIVLDPVLAAGGGHALADQALIQLIYEHFLPKVYLLTPNRAEARRLSGECAIEVAASQLLAQGCQHILLTGADEAKGEQVVNTLYSKTGGTSHFYYPKLPRHYHGSGCTLASACTCQLAKELNVYQAVQAAQRFTWRSLSDAENIGHGQYLPRRFSV